MVGCQHKTCTQNYLRSKALAVVAQLMKMHANFGIFCWGGRVREDTQSRGGGGDIKHKGKEGEWMDGEGKRGKGERIQNLGFQGN